MNKKQFLVLIGSLVYVIILGSIIPIIIINLNLFLSIYNFFAELARDGVFFVLWMVSTFFFFPFIYSTLVKEKLSFNVRSSKTKQKNPRYYAHILLLIGLPIMIWLILGNLGFYSITKVSGGGLTIFIKNGFFVSLLILFDFCIFPGIVLGLKKNKY